MNLGNTFTIAIKALWTNKVRSFLTMLGVIIGVGSVVLLTSIGTGLQKYVEDQFAGLGANTLYVVPGNPFGEGSFGPNEQAFVESTRPVLKRSYLRTILRENRDLIRDGVVSAVGVAEAKYQESTERVTLYGVTPNYETVQNTLAETGRWFTESEEQKGDRVALLGAEIAADLFGQVDPVGKKMMLDGKSYQVLGVIEEKGGGFGGPSFDSYVYLPLETLQSDFNVELIDSFILQVVSQDQVKEAQTRVENSLLAELEEDEFSVIDQTQLLDTINSILGVLTAGLGAIAAISLVVGGIGIMNIMLVSVTERTKEIGLRKALGATPNVILAQFLMEAALLSIIGGLIGIGIAFAGSLAIQSAFPAQVTWQAVALAFGVSTAVGLVFGVAPAKRAASLSPIEALRYE